MVRTAFALLAVLTIATAPAPLLARDRVGDDFRRIDADGDDHLSRAEWNRRGNFDRLDTDHDGRLSLSEVRAMYAGHDDRSYDWPPAGFTRAAAAVDPGAETDRVGVDAVGRQAVCGIARGRKCDADDAIRLGLLETGLGPVFPPRAACPNIDDGYALDYGFKRSGEAYHGGIDLPARWGTPMIAAAAGTVIAVYEGAESARGIEVILRHAPEDTGLPMWTYTGYGHLDRMPDLKVGQRVVMGEIIGPTGNSGLSGKQRKQTTDRRPAIHFSAFFAEDPKYAEVRDVIVPVGGRWLDPVAFYRTGAPFESSALKALSDSEKDVAVPVMYGDGATEPAATKRVWPYACTRD